MKNLKRLWLGGNQIQDITPLENTTSIRKLHLAFQSDCRYFSDF